MQKQCVQCGEPFFASNGRKVYCDDACKQAAHRRRKDPLVGSPQRDRVRRIMFERSHPWKWDPDDLRDFREIGVQLGGWSTERDYDSYSDSDEPPGAEGVAPGRATRDGLMEARQQNVAFDDEHNPQPVPPDLASMAPTDAVPSYVAPSADPDGWEPLEHDRCGKPLCAICYPHDPNATTSVQRTRWLKGVKGMSQGTAAVEGWAVVRFACELLETAQLEDTVLAVEYLAHDRQLEHDALKAARESRKRTKPSKVSDSRQLCRALVMLADRLLLDRGIDPNILERVLVVLAYDNDPKRNRTRRDRLTKQQLHARVEQLEYEQLYLRRAQRALEARMARVERCVDALEAGRIAATQRHLRAIGD